MPDRRDQLRAALGRVGVWSFNLQARSATDERSSIARLADLGYRATWFPESLGSKEAFAHAAILLEGDRRMVIATGIANIHARDPMAMANGGRTLAEAYPGRFVLGLGVSHKPSVAVRGGSYGGPIEQMTAYLDAMETAAYSGPQPAEPLPIVLAALGPRMLELAAARTAGAHPYFVPVEHTRIARAVMGETAFLAVEQTAVLDTDDERSSQIARTFAANYLGLENYANNLRRLGFTDDDVAGSGSDRLRDAVIVRGGPDAIVARVREHLDAGADHVCVQLRTAQPGDPFVESYAGLAEALGPLLKGRTETVGGPPA